MAGNELNIKLTPELLEELLREELNSVRLFELLVKYQEFASKSNEGKPENPLPLNQLQEAFSLHNFKKSIKDTLMNNAGKALNALIDCLIPHTNTSDKVVGLLTRYNRINQWMQLGMVGFQYADTELVKIEHAIIYIVNNLEESDILDTFKGVG